MSSQPTQNGQSQPSVEMPPAMADIKSKSADEVLKEMNRMPLFMTTLDETDGDGNENMMLEAIKALAYEGTKTEVAENFRQQGNECARAKQWTDAKEFYDKAIAAIKGYVQKVEKDPDAPDESQFDYKGKKIYEVEVDEKEEEEQLKVIEEACYVNRALCNLEKKNYRSCIQDCASTLRLNPTNIKALYRSGTACLSLDKLPEAKDACTRGLTLDPTNAPLKSLSQKIAARETHLASVAKARQEREDRERAEKGTLTLALRSRGILTRSTDNAPDLEDAAVKLEKSLDPSSTLIFPVMMLYPLDSQSDFIKAFSEKERIVDHLEYIFPLPWDTKHEYSVEGVEAYMETVQGGLIKAGKKMALGKILGSGKVEVVDGLVRVFVLPKGRVEGWIEEFKKRRTVK